MKLQKLIDYLGKRVDKKDQKALELLAMVRGEEVERVRRNSKRKAKSQPKKKRNK